MLAVISLHELDSISLQDHELVGSETQLKLLLFTTGIWISRIIAVISLSRAE